MTLDEQIDYIESYLISSQIPFKKNWNLKYETYFKTGGVAKIFCAPNNKQQLTKCVLKLSEKKIEYRLLGYTSNVLFFDEIDYTIIITTKNINHLQIKDNIATVEAGYSLYEFVRVVSVLNESKGFEGLEGIPGSIGGAIFMNAAAYGNSISDNLIDVEAVDMQTLKLIKLSKKQCEFSYRESVFRKSNMVILSARFCLVKGNILKIERKIEAIHIARHSYQEYVYPNLGSMISIDKDIYTQLVGANKINMAILFFLKLCFKNPLIKLLKRKKPDNNIFNSFIIRILGKTKNQISKKSINILLNTPTSTSETHLEYIQHISQALGQKYKIENELITTPIYKVNKGFQKLSHKK